MKVIVTLNAWMKDFWEDFTDALLEDMQAFINFCSQQETLKKYASMLQSTLTKQIENPDLKWTSYVAVTSAPEPLWDAEEECSLLKIHPVEVRPSLKKDGETDFFARVPAPARSPSYRTDWTKVVKEAG